MIQRMGPHTKMLWQKCWLILTEKSKACQSTSAKRNRLKRAQNCPNSENVEADFQDYELADALAVESLIDLQVTFEKLINDKYKRLNDALRQIEWCKGFADRLKRACDAAIEASVHGSKEEGLEAESTTLAPETE